MFSLLSTTPTLTAASAGSAPRGSARGGGRRVASTAVVASAGPATTPKIGAMCERVQRIAASSVLAATLVLSPLAAAPAFAEGCQTTCEAECLKVAPGSGDYCTSACSDECSALKGAFGQRQEKGDFENLLEKMLDTQKVFFVGPASQMKK